MLTTPCAVWVVGSAADFASMRVALERDYAQEANSLQGQGPLRQAAIQAGSAAVGCWADARLRRDGHRSVARGLRVAVLVLKLALAVNNLR